MGQVAASQLYDLYGRVRYTSGTLPTDRGYTGQRADALTGLDYYNARYYDPMGAVHQRRYDAGRRVKPLRLCRR